MTQFTFAQEHHYDDGADGITLPTELHYQGTQLVVTAKVDTGATHCLFRNEHGRALGINIEQGIPLTLSTLNGPLDAYGHEVVIQTLGLAFESTVYFAKYPGLQRNLLGRQGWLRNLRLALIDYDNTLYLSAYDATE